jgi:hypothetical protein
LVGRIDRRLPPAGPRGHTKRVELLFDNQADLQSAVKYAPAALNFAPSAGHTPPPSKSLLTTEGYINIDIDDGDLSSRVISRAFNVAECRRDR